MTEYLDSLHDGQFFLGKQVVTTTKKIQVLSLSGNTNHPEFILYHSNEPSHELFYPFVSSKPFEIVLPRKNAKTQFKVQEFNNLFYLYLNGELVHYHTQYFDKLFLDSKSPAILTDTNYYQITQEYADSYNVIHKLISQTQQQEEETQQELTQEEIEQIEVEETTQEEPVQEVVIETQQEESTQEVVIELQQEDIQVQEPIQEVVVEMQQEDVQEIQVQEPVQEVIVEMQQEDVQEIQVQEPVQEVIVEMQQEDVQEIQVQEPVQEVVVELQQEDNQEMQIEEPVQEIIVEMKEEEVAEKEIKKSVTFEEDTKQNETMSEILQDFQNVSVQQPQKAMIHMIDFHHLNKNYKIPCLKLDASPQINFKQIHQEMISINNNIEQENISIHVPEMNQYYLIQFKRTKFLLYRMNQTLIITNIQTKNSKIVKNKEMVRILSYNFILTNHASLLVPMEQKRFFDNHYGTTVSTFVPRT